GQSRSHRHRAWQCRERDARHPAGARLRHTREWRPGSACRTRRRGQRHDDGVGKVMSDQSRGSSGSSPKTALWVIVPAYNEAARIDATLGALAAQTDRDFTLVVIDNGSADRTCAIVRGFAAMAPFAVHLIKEQVKGIGYAVDTGFRYAIRNG